MKINLLAAAVALPDRELLARIDGLAGNEREATAELVAHLAALEMRSDLYLADGYGSLFDYCTRALRLSEDAACNRIEAARACTRFPVILGLLAEGTVTLTAVRKLRSHLTPANHEAVLRKATTRTKEQIEALIAELAPKPDVPTMVRKVPGTIGVAGARRETPALPALVDLPSEPAPPKMIGRAEASAPRAPRPIVQALAPERYRVQFTIGQETHDRLRRVQALVRRQIPDGDPAAIFDRALRLLEEVEGKKLGFGAQPRRRGSGTRRNYENRIRSGTDKRAPGLVPAQGEQEEKADAAPQTGRPGADNRSRHIPAAVKRAVWFRDAGQCAFISNGGRRCMERSFLELHHIHPYALEGPATVGNIALRCRRHNQYEGELVFGPRRSIAPNPEHRGP